MTTVSGMQHLVILDGLLPSDSCFSQGYIGTFGKQSLYLPTDECAFENASVLNLDAESFVSIPEGTVMLYWIGEMSLEDEVLANIKPPMNPWEHLDSQLFFAAHDRDQQILGDWRSPILYRTDTASLLAFRGADASQYFKIDTVLAPYLKAYAIPYPPTPLVPVPRDDVARVASLLKGLKYNDTVAKLVDSISVGQMHKDVTWLTGEAPDSPIESRHSFHPDARKAAQWIKEQIEGTGASCELRPFLTGFTPNIIWYAISISRLY